MRGMVQELIAQKRTDFYLTSGRVLEHYNNAAQTKESEKLLKRHSEDVVLVSAEDATFFEAKEQIVLRSHYGKSNPLKFKITKKVKKGNTFTSLFIMPKARSIICLETKRMNSLKRHVLSL